MPRALPFVLASLLLFVARAALAAPTLQAPAGGRAVPLPNGQVACGPASGEWAIESDPHQVRPPKEESAIGHVESLKVASAPGGCAAATAAIDLVTTARMPLIDATSVSLSVDDGRLDVRGKGLRGLGVHWQQADRAGDDRCVNPEVVAGVEHCAFAVTRGIPANPDAAGLSWFPAGGRAAGADVTTYDAQGRLVDAAETALRPARVVVSQLVPSDVSIDLAGVASRVPLTHPSAVLGAECTAATCDVEDDAIVVRGLHNLGASIAVRLRLAPHVFFAKAGTDGADANPSFSIAVLPCAMSIVSGDALRAVDDARVVVKLDGRCAGDGRNVRFAVGVRPAPVVDMVTVDSAAYVLVRVGRLDDEDLVVTGLRGQGAESVVGVARARTRPAPEPRSSLSLANGAPVDFIPTNRDALVHFAAAGDDRGRLEVLPVDGAYDVSAAPTGVTVRGVKGAAGFVSLRFGYRVPSLPGRLAHEDLGVLVDPIERGIKEANVPAPIGATADSGRPLVELLCIGDDKAVTAVKPGDATHIPFSQRDSCRIVFHRERLSPEDGAQRLHVEIEVQRVDGENRAGAHVSQSIVLRPSTDPLLIWVKGVQGAFDRITVRIAHDADESHYVAGSFDDPHAAAPSVQWAVITGEGHFRLYATTAIPTGLYRVSTDNSGILTLNFGALARFTWLDGDGHEGFLGLEGGVMGVGLTGNASTNQSQATQVAAVIGAGLSVPIANRSLATETSINLHAWLEDEVSRTSGNPIGFVFGPSISIGNIGTNL